ncbi:MAG TPA: hypothetical protein VND45_05755 [Thermoanaerobaculia bacterium]|nr:hypothetical protein [Thermoanaerobaculia bacterium]
MSTAARKRTKGSPAAERCRRKFLRFFPDAFRDETYFDWERGYKQAAHEQWEELLGELTFRGLLKKREFAEIAQRAARIEGKTNLLFSFEKMALRDAVKSPEGAEAFARGLYDFLYGSGSFEKWVEVVGALPRRQTRVLTWPLVTVFGFIAKPEEHIFLKPNVTRVAAREYGFEFDYRSKPNRETYDSLRQFAETIRREQSDLRPKDLIDLQSFIWVQGSDEYE